MSSLAVLKAYEPPKDGDFQMFILFLQRSGFTKEMAVDLLGWKNVTGIPACEFAWLSELSRSRFQTPEHRADLEARLTAIADRIKDAATRRQYHIFFREKLRNFFGFDYRQRAQSNVIPIRRKNDLLGSLANLERLQHAVNGIATDGGAGDAAEYLRSNVSLLHPQSPQDDII